MKVLDQLEEQINQGFFLSFMNKIVVDEKKIFTIINELRSLVSEHFAKSAEPAPSEPEDTPMQEPAAPGPAVPAAENDPQDEAAARDIVDQALRKAEQLRHGADKYADSLLAGIEERLTSALDSVRKGRRAIEDRDKPSGGEHHGSSEI